MISCVQKINYVELVLTSPGEEWSFCWGFCVIGQASDTLFFVCLADSEESGFISNGIHFWGDLTTMCNVCTSGGKWCDGHWCIYETWNPVMVSDAYLFLHVFNRESNASAKENHGTSSNVINLYGRRGNNQTFSTGVKPIAVRNTYKKTSTINHCSTLLHNTRFNNKVVSASIFDYLTRDQDDRRETILTRSFPLVSFFAMCFSMALSLEIFINVNNLCL